MRSHGRHEPSRSARLLLNFLRPLFWAVTFTEDGRHLMWDRISKESHVRSRQARETPLQQLIKSKRDRAMSDKLRLFVQDPARIRAGQPAAVVAGAAHMPALYETLRACGFQKGSVRWFEVLEGLTVPSRGTDGRATPAARKP